MMKDCSVCTCSENEIPLPWLSSPASQIPPSEDFIGWVSTPASVYGYDGKGHDESLGVVHHDQKYKSNLIDKSHSNISSNHKYIQHLIETEKHELGMYLLTIM